MLTAELMESTRTSVTSATTMLNDYGVYSDEYVSLWTYHDKWWVGVLADGTFGVELGNESYVSDNLAELEAHVLRYAADDSLWS